MNMRSTAIEIKSLSLISTLYVLIFPNIESGNAFYKAMTVFAYAEMAGLLQGPVCPVVLPSRSDSGLSKYYSMAMACLTSNDLDE